MEHWVRNVLRDAVGDPSRLDAETQADLSRIADLIEQRDVYVFRRPELDQVADEIADCATIDELGSLMVEGARICGFDHVSIFGLRQGDGQAFRTRVCTSFPMEWMANYGARSYQFVDPVLAHAQLVDTPFEYSQLDDRIPAIAAFWEDAVRAGIGREGLAVAFDMGGGTRVGVSFGSARTADEVSDMVRRGGSDALALARLGADAFLYLARGTGDSGDTLSATELRFLHILVTTDNPEEAVRSMPGFGSPTTMQASIARKLGVTNILQAVALASSNGWFDDMPYDWSDIARVIPELNGWRAPEDDAA